MDSFYPFSLRFCNVSGGPGVAPTRSTLVDAGSDTIKAGDPFQVEDGAAMEYNAGDGVFGVALYDFPAYVASSKKDQGRVNQPLMIAVDDEAVYFTVQAKYDESGTDIAVTQAAVYGRSFNLAGDAGKMYLDVSAAGTDFKVTGIDSMVSEWGDLYPVLIVKCINPQDTDPTA